jgi:hypothetical protein
MKIGDAALNMLRVAAVQMCSTGNIEANFA